MLALGAMAICYAVGPVGNLCTSAKWSRTKQLFFNPEVKVFAIISIIQKADIKVK